MPSQRDVMRRLYDENSGHDEDTVIAYAEAEGVSEGDAWKLLRDGQTAGWLLHDQPSGSTSRPIFPRREHRGTHDQPSGSTSRPIFPRREHRGTNAWAWIVLMIVFGLMGWCGF